MQEPNRDLTPVAASATVATMQRELNEPQAANRSAWQAIQESKAVLEPLARLGAILLGATYLAGFLIVMQHHATFGIVDVGVLRARVMAAGVLFVLLTVLPMIMAARIYRWWGLSTLTIFTPLAMPEQNHAWREILAGVPVFGGCFLLADFTSALFVEESVTLNPWYLLVFLVVPVDVLLTIKRSSTHPLTIATLNVISSVIVAWGATEVLGRNFLWRLLWFFGCAIAMPVRCRTACWVAKY